MRRWGFFVVLVPGAAQAGGLLVGDTGSQATERGGAFVAKSDDPTALGDNPAGLAENDGRVEIYLGVNVLAYSESFTRAGKYPDQSDNVPDPSYANTPFPTVKNGSSAQPIPTFSIVEHLWRGLSIAEGVLAPQSFPGRDFPCPVVENCVVDPKTGAPSPQRYDVVNQSALIALPSIAVAYRVNRYLDVGLRGSWGFGSLNAETYAWGVQNGEEDPNKDAAFKLNVHDSFIPAFGAGVLVKPTDNLEIGASYSSELDMDGKGTGTTSLGSGLTIGTTPDNIDPVPDAMAKCAKGGTVTALKACVDLTIPQSATIGARWIFRDAVGGERADIELDGDWENWSKASNINVIVDGKDHLTGFYLNPVTIKHGFRDTFAARLGGAYRIIPALTVRAGLSYDSAAAPLSWTRADMDGKDRYLASIGLAYRFARRFVVDAGFSYVAEPTRTVTDVVPENVGDVGSRTQPDPAQPLHSASSTSYDPFNAGVYTSSYAIGELGLTATF